VEFILAKYIDGVQPSRIYAELAQNYEKSNRKLHAIVQDFYNLFLKHTIKEDLEYVLKNPKLLDPTLQCTFSKNEENQQIDYIFFYFQDVVERNRNYCEVMRVYSTHKTNHYDMKLVLLTCIDNHGMTNPFACALLKNETKENYAKFFKGTTSVLGKICYLRLTYIM